MIRFPLEKSELKRQIRQTDPAWFDKADKALENVKENRFTWVAKQQKSHWRDIKAVYKTIQSNKCGFCERLLESQQTDGTPLKYESDVEHFRPKAEVRPWEFEGEVLGEVSESGYPMLAYNPWNYLLSCETCNRHYKQNFFPITGERVEGSEETCVGQYTSEEPILIYPISDWDPDPETIIGFKGIHPVPFHDSGRENLIARVIIDLLGLDIRDTLLLQRAGAIRDMWFVLKHRDDPLAQRALATQLSPKEAHTNCKKAFVRCYEDDPDQARHYLAEAMDYIKSNQF